MTDMYIEEQYIIVDKGGAAYLGELGYGFKRPISIYIPRWCAVDCPLQWDVELEILGVLPSWCKIMSDMNHCPSARLKTSNVNKNGACSPVCTFHIHSPWINL